MASFKAQITNQFSSITLPTTGFWRLKTQESGIVITASETQQGDVVISNFTGEGIIEAKANNQEVWVKTDQADGIQSNLIVENFFFDKVIAGGGGGQPTTNLVFQSPLKKSGDSVSLTIAQNKGLTIDQDALTLDLAQNTEFTSLSNDLDSYKQSNDQAIQTIKADLNQVYTKNEANNTFATKQEVTDLGNSVLKTTGDQSANGVKTFLDGYKGVNKGTGQYTIADNVLQGEKAITFNFQQPTSGFVNYSTLEAKIKVGNDTARRFFGVSAEGDLNQTYMYVLNNKLKFKSPTLIQNVQDGVDATDAVNKGQLDGAFNPLSTKVTTLEGAVDALRAKGQFVSIATFTKAEAEANSFAKLNEFVQQNTNPSRPPQIGDEVVTSDNFRFIYAKGNNGDTWVVEASQMPEVATAQRLGLVKFGTLEGEVEDKGGGVMQVKGYSTLKALVESHTDEIQDLTTELGDKATLQSLQTIQTQVNQNAQTLQQTQTALQSKADASQVYTKVDADGKFATKTSLQSVSDKANQNEQSIATIQQNLVSVSDKADTNEGDIATLQGQLANKADDNVVVKLQGDQTIDGKKTFGSAIGVTTNYELQGETGQLRIQPTANDKYVKLGNPTTNKYFVAIDLDNKVGIIGLKNPTNDNDAANKIYVDTKHGSITTSLNDVTQKANVNETAIQQINTTLGQKANTSDVYTQSQADGKFALITALTPVSNKADANEQAIQTINNTLNSKANSADVVKLNAGSTQTLQDALAIQKDGSAFSIIYSTATAQSYFTFSQGGTTENFKLGKTTTDLNDFYFTGSDTNSRWIFSQKAQYASSDITINDDAQFIHKKYLNDNYYNKSTADGKYATQDVVNRDFLRKNVDGTLNANVTMAQNKTIIFRDQIKIGYGSGECRMTSEDGSTKTLKFYGQGTNNFLNLDLGNKAGLTGLKTPTNNSDASNKEYVDTAVSGVDPGKMVQLAPNTRPTTSDIPSGKFSFIYRG